MYMMPGKRNRKDMVATNTVPINSGSSTSSVDEESEDAADCCFPGMCPYGDATKTRTSLMVKVVCNSDACTMSQFMHVDCFNHFEEGILNYLRANGRARNWSDKQRRQNLWTKKGYDLAYRACLCKCKHGHLRKDLDWNPSVSSEQPGCSEVGANNTKKKNRKKHKDLPVLIIKSQPVAVQQRSKSKPIPNNAQHRTRHYSTSSSVDQGYISGASPCTSEPIFSPPFYPSSSRPAHILHHQRSHLHAPSTSPLPEVPDTDDDEFPAAAASGCFSPPFSPESARQNNGAQHGNVEAMTAIINRICNHRQPTYNAHSHPCQQPPPFASSGGGIISSFVDQYQQLIPDYQQHGWQQTEVWQTTDQNLLRNQQLFNQLHLQEQETKDISAGKVPQQRTEVRLIPMRSTTFAKRYDFSAFQSVLPRQHVNPYHIKMEGEGYGSDDLRNFILSSLSSALCSQMNCVMCGVDMPVYDHFPLVDGTMFLSPEKNENNTKNCFKIKVDQKYEYIHAACLRCLEGLHNIVCRFCDARWEGSHHQLGTLYMYDILAANPCCQARLRCKHCGAVVVDIGVGLNYFSAYSELKQCPRCHVTDHHLIHPASSYQLVGIVFS